jgi:hypothetical protein
MPGTIADAAAVVLIYIKRGTHRCHGLRFRRVSAAGHLHTAPPAPLSAFTRRDSAELI